MNKQKIKKLASIAGSEKKVPTDISEYVMTYLSKSDLKLFLNFYKSALDKKRVYVESASTLSQQTRDQITNIFNCDEIVSIIEKELGAGIKIRHDDMFIDFTIKSIINDTIEQLKN